MRLAELQARAAEVLEGRASTATLPLDEATAARFDIYRRFCALHRRSALVHVYSETFSCLPTDSHDAVIEAYFGAHPMFHAELNENGAHFAAWLAGTEHPPWLAELADFEWWEWRTRVAPDGPAAAPQLALHSTVELRPYRHDLIGWLAARPPSPLVRDLLVVFWRTAEHRVRREIVTQPELDVLRAVFAGEPPPHPDTVRDLIAAGILVAPA